MYRLVLEIPVRDPSQIASVFEIVVKHAEESGAAVFKTGNGVAWARGGVLCVVYASLRPGVGMQPVAPGVKILVQMSSESPEKLVEEAGRLERSLRGGGFSCVVAGDSA